VEADYKKEFKQVFQDLVLAKTGEEIQFLLKEIKKFVLVTENNEFEIKERE